MSTTATIPVLNPETGDVHAIPTDQVDQARQAGGKPVAKMQDPTGTMRYVPMEQMDDARKAGGKLIPYGSNEPTDMGVGDYIKMGWNALTTPEPTGTRPGVLGNAETAVHNIGGRALSGMASAVTHPLDTLQSMAEMTPPGTAIDAALGRQNPIQKQIAGYQADYAKDKPLAVENAVGDALGAYEGGRMAGGVFESKPVQAVVNKVTAPITNFATPRMVPVPGENFTPQQHASFSGVLARGSGAGKGYFPKDVASSIGSATRQAAADNPGIHQAIMNGSPEDSLAGTQALLGKVREGVDAAHQKALGPVAETPVDPSPIQNAVSFPDSLKDFAPQDAAAVTGLRTRLGNVRTLGGLNDLRMYLNQELSPQFRQNPVAAGNTGAVTRAMQDALKATRDQYYTELENATGQDFQGAKRMESGVMSAQEALGNAAPGMAARQAIAEQPRSMRGYAAEALQGAHTVSGGPVAGVSKLLAKEVLGETPMTPVQEGLRNFFKNPPARTPLQPAGPQIFQGSTTTNPSIITPPARLPAQTAGQSPAPVAPQSLSERLANSYGSQASSRFPQPYQEPSTPPAELVPDRGAFTVGPDGVAQRGPAGLLPERTGGPLQLGSGSGNPEFVVPPASPPAPVNPATAGTSVYAGRPMVRPVNQSLGTINVSPDGSAVVQRPQLAAPKAAKGTALPIDPRTGLPGTVQPATPAGPEVRYKNGRPFVQAKNGWWVPKDVGIPEEATPATHAFSRSAWQKANPRGDIEAASAEAKRRGFKVGD